MIVYDYEHGAYIRRSVEPEDVDNIKTTYYSKEAVKDIIYRYKRRLIDELMKSEEDTYIPEMPDITDEDGDWDDNI